jgi:hypothetical protein
VRILVFPSLVVPGTGPVNWWLRAGAAMHLAHNELLVIDRALASSELCVG